MASTREPIGATDMAKLGIVVKWLGKTTLDNVWVVSKDMDDSLKGKEQVNEIMAMISYIVGILNNASANVILSYYK